MQRLMHQRKRSTIVHVRNEDDATEGVLSGYDLTMVNNGGLVTVRGRLTQGGHCEVLSLIHLAPGERLENVPDDAPSFGPAATLDIRS